MTIWSMLRTTESYLFRRTVCDVATNSLNKFILSMIARLNAVQEEGGNYREAFEAILLGEEGTVPLLSHILPLMSNLRMERSFR